LVDGITYEIVEWWKKHLYATTTNHIFREIKKKIPTISQGSISNRIEHLIKDGFVIVRNEETLKSLINLRSPLRSER